MVLEEVLGKTYGGTIVSDFFSAYVKYANSLQQFCLAHLIRDIKFLTTLPTEIDKRFGQRLLIEFKRLFHSHPITHDDLVIGFIGANKHAGLRSRFQNVSLHFFLYALQSQ